MTFKNKIASIIHNWRIVLSINLLVFSSFSIIYGQETREEQIPYELNTREDTPPIKERLFYGGSFGLMFGTITDIQVSPVIGFWVLPRVAVAVGPTYRYYKDQIDRTAIYGGRSYLQLVVIKDLSSVLPLGVHTGVFLHFEDELLSLKTSFWKNPPPYKTERFYVNTVLAGAGISQQIGRRSSLNFMVLWPLNDSGYNIYSKPEIKISFTF
jgi:hypothetical protein